MSLPYKLLENLFTTLSSRSPCKISPKKECRDTSTFLSHTVETLCKRHCANERTNIDHSRLCDPSLDECYLRMERGSNMRKERKKLVIHINHLVLKFSLAIYQAKLFTVENAQNNILFMITLISEAYNFIGIVFGNVDRMCTQSLYPALSGSQRV